MDRVEVVDWRELDIARLILLERAADTVFIGRQIEDNGFGRIFGGQILAQALAAIAHTLAPDRPIHALQLMFCASGRLDKPVRYAVQALSDGATTSVRSLRIEQGGRILCVATASARQPSAAFEHNEPLSRPVSGPEYHADAATLVERHRVEMGGHALERVALKSAIEVRLVDAPRHLADPPPGGDGGPVHFWVRSPRPLPDDPMAHQCAVAYLTDYILAHVPPRQVMSYPATKGLAAASVNHALWFYRPLRADEWLLVEVCSPVATAGRGLATAKVYDGQHRVAAVTTQEFVYSASGLRGKDPGFHG